VNLPPLAISGLNTARVLKNILVGEDRAKGKGQRAKGENFKEIFFLHSTGAHSKFPLPWNF
jgi:hypothetical protein